MSVKEILQTEFYITQHNWQPKKLPISNNSCLQATAEEANNSVLLSNHFDGLHVRDGQLVRLLCCLDDAKTVTACVGNDGGGEADDSVSPKLLHCVIRVWFGQMLLLQNELK